MNKNRSMGLVALAALLASSAVQADGFYIEGGLSALLNRGSAMRPEVIVTDFYSKDGISVMNSFEMREVSFAPYDRPQVVNPYGDIAFGYDWDWRRITIDLQARHRSSLQVADHGDDVLSLSVRWYPFRR